MKTPRIVENDWWGFFGEQAFRFQKNARVKRRRSWNPGQEWSPASHTEDRLEAGLDSEHVQGCHPGFPNPTVCAFFRRRTDSEIVQLIQSGAWEEERGNG